jgi:3-methyladenine DNA glycosylase/8-oxoguanine DNA glycosylase
MASVRFAARDISQTLVQSIVTTAALDAGGGKPSLPPLPPHSTRRTLSPPSPVNLATPDEGPARRRTSRFRRSPASATSRRGASAVELKLSRLATLCSDDDVIGILTEVKGIGHWTAQMFLIFSLGRLDVFPVGDLGIRKAIRDRWN